jgi:hypothetical protein
MVPLKVGLVLNGGFRRAYYGCYVHRRWKIHRLLLQRAVWFQFLLVQQTDYGLLSCRGWAHRLRCDRAVSSALPATLPFL